MLQGIDHLRDCDIYRPTSVQKIRASYYCTSVVIRALYVILEHCTAVSSYCHSPFQLNLARVFILIVELIACSATVEVWSTAEVSEVKKVKGKQVTYYSNE